MFGETPAISSDLDWMMQSNQVNETLLTQALWGEFAADIYALGFIVLGDEEKARQVVKKTIETAVKKRYSYWGEPGLKAWVIRIAFRITKREKWKGSLRLRLDIRNLASKSAINSSLQPSPRESTSTQDLTLVEVINSLATAQRLLLHLRYVVNMPAEEIAYVLTVKPSHILRSLRALRGIMLDRSHPPEDQKARRPLRGIHNAFLKNIHLATDGCLENEAQDQLKRHLEGCELCWGYALELREFETGVIQALQALYSELPLSADDRLEIGNQNVDKSHAGDRRRPKPIKESALVAIMVVGVLALVRFSNLMAPPPEEPAVPTDVAWVIAPYAGISQPVDPAHPYWENRTVDSSDVYTLRWEYSFPIPPDFSLDIVRDFSSPLPPTDWSSWNDPAARYVSNVEGFWDWQRDFKAAFQNKEIISQLTPVKLIPFLEHETILRGIVRVGGEIDLLKRLLLAGYPVLVELDLGSWKVEPVSNRYAILVGFKDTNNSMVLWDFNSMDLGKFTIDYDTFERSWRPFNYTYLVAFPPNRERFVESILGAHVDKIYNFRQSLSQSSLDILEADTDLNALYAWFNRGTSLTELEDYTGAVTAYDKAIEIYQSLPQDRRPAFLWGYYAQPYKAYYETGRFQDVVDLTGIALTTSGPILEEFYLWRGLAKEALRDIGGAIDDLTKSVKINPGFELAQYHLNRVRAGP